MKIKLHAALAGAVTATVLSLSARADCTLTNTGRVPLCDLGTGAYLGQQGGLYPGGSNQRPAAHEAFGVALATNEILPRDAAGNVDTNAGKIVLMSIGMSNTTQEWATRGGSNFTALANADPAKNPRVVIVDGAQGGQDVRAYSNANASVWNTVFSRLDAAGATSNQVQVIWLKQVLAFPMNYSTNFPTHAQIFQNAAAQVLRNAKAKFPQLKAVYVSSRTRCYSSLAVDGSPEPYAYEVGFGDKWLVEDQLLGRNNLNFDPTNGPVVAPWVTWGPYLWTDGETPRSDGLTWLCTDTADLQHPSTDGGVPKVAAQLLAFFKTDPTTRPWFLKSTVTGAPPACAPAASATNGAAPLVVNFTANASDADGSVIDYRWNFDDGTSASVANPQKTFFVPGAHRVRLTVTDNAGNTATSERLVNVTATGGTPLAITTLSPLAAATVGAAYAQPLAALGGLTPYAWSVASGALPGGLILNTGGSLTGTPTNPGTFNFSLRVADATNAQVTNAFALTVNAASGGDGPWENLADGSQGRTTSYVAMTGEVIPAYVRKPAGNGPFPLVLMIHGGGTSSNGTYALGRLMNPPTPQFLAAGFVIYAMDFSAVNPGNAFSTGEWELAARAIETAQRLPYVDARRVALVGQSHGGMVACRAASRLDVLCAVPCAPAAIDPIAAWEYQQSGGAISPSLQNVINQTPAMWGAPDMATLAANPAAYGYHDVTDDAPAVRHPLLLVSGQNDLSSPTNVMNNYGAALVAAGKYFETYYPANGPHGFVFSAPLIPETTEFTTRAVNFLTKYFSLADADNDGLPDGWELARFNSLAQGAAGDPDADGADNFAEWRAGTHPLDPASVLRITSVLRTPAGQVQLRFPLVPGLSHVIEHSGNLQTWQAVSDAALTEPLTGIVQWLDDGTLTGGLENTRFYRVRLP